MELNDAFVNTYIKKMKETVDDLQGRLIISETTVEILQGQVKEKDTQIEDIVEQYRKNEVALNEATTQAAKGDKYDDLAKSLDVMTVKYEGTLSDYLKVQSDVNNYEHILNQKNDLIENLKQEIQSLRDLAPVKAAVSEDGFEAASTKPATESPYITTTRIANSHTGTATTVGGDAGAKPGTYWDEVVTVSGAQDEEVNDWLKPKSRARKTQTKK